MQTISIKELQTNPALLTRSLEANEYTMITRRSKPIGMAFSFEDTIVTDGLKTALMIDAYKKGYLSMGQFADVLTISHEEAMKLLSMMGVDIIDYNFEDDMQLLNSIYPTSPNNSQSHHNHSYTPFREESLYTN